MVITTQTGKTQAIVGTALTTGVGLSTLATGTALAISSKRSDDNRLSKATIAALAVGGVITLAGGIALTIVSLVNVGEFIYIAGQYTSTETKEDNSVIFSNKIKLAYSGGGGRGGGVVFLNTYLAKYDKAGTLQWAKSITSSEKGGNFPVSILN